MGLLSIVTGAYSTPITTLPSTPLLNTLGQPTGQSLAGATTVELTPQQAAAAARPNGLWLQGGTTTDPILNQRYPGQYGFAALRCSIDNLNGDNVEWIGFPTGVSHVFCYAYYVQPPPTSGTIVIRKQTVNSAGISESFPFAGNISFNEGGKFALSVNSGQAAQQSFYRAETRPGEAPWEAQETVPPNWRLAGLTCTSQSGMSSTTTNLASAAVSIKLAPTDTVTCTYTDEFVPPPGGLLIRKVTHGGTGHFTFKATPGGGGPGTSASAETRQEDVAVDAQPSPLSLAPGDYALTETPTHDPAGRWALSTVQCDGRDQPATQPIHVTIASGASTTCTLGNTFTPFGSIEISKITEGALATTGFIVSPRSGPANQLHQSATTTHEGKPSIATGDPTHGLELGHYLIQETGSQPVGNGHWELTGVQCNGRDIPFAAGQADVTLSASAPHQKCTFTNLHLPTPEPHQPDAKLPEPTVTLTVHKRAVSPHDVPGQPVAYAITVANHGPAAALDVVVTDQPSGPASLVSAHPSKGACDHNVPLTCTLGMLAAGHTATVYVRMLPHVRGSFTNRAIVGTSTADLTFNRDAASAHISVLGSLEEIGPTHTLSPSFTG